MGERRGSLAFYDCTSLTEVSIPKTLSGIYTQAFQNCTALKTVYNFSDLDLTKESSDNGYVAYYADYVYNNCEAWQAGFLYQRNGGAFAAARYKGAATVVTVPSTFKGKAVTGISDGCFIGNTAMTKVTIPESIISIGNSAFEGCTALTSVTLPNSLTTLGERAFYGDTALASVHFGSGIDFIPWYGFYGCSSLAELVIPANVKYIGYQAFLGCSSIKNMDFGHGLISIGYQAFEGVSNIEYISLASATPVVLDAGTFTVTTGTPLYVPEGIIEGYKNMRGNPWGAFEILPLIDITAVNVSGLEELQEVPIGTPIKLSAVIEPAEASLPYIFWRSTDLEMATVDTEGNVIVSSSVTNPALHVTAMAAMKADSSRECQIIAETMYADAPSVVITLTGDVVTAIETINADCWFDTSVRHAPRDIYTTQGILLKRNATQADVDALAPGLYIVGSKKMVVR